MLTACLFATYVQASDALDNFRVQGVIIERFDGFVELRDGSATSAARSLVKDINEKRRVIYEKRASEQEVSVDAVGKIFAKKIIETAPVGTIYLRPDGNYTKK